MVEKIQINALDMVRRIRDEQATMLAGKSNAEIIAFFKKAAERERQEAKLGESTGPQVARKA
jgi:hypothetical protein